MGFAFIDNFGSSPFEGGGQVEDGVDVEIAMGVYVSPGPHLDWGKAVTKLVGVLEAGVYDQLAQKVAVAVFAIFLHEGHAVVEDVGFGAIAAVVELDGKDDFSVGVYNAPVVVKGDGCTLVFKKSGLVVLAGNDFFPFGVEIAILAVAGHEDATFGQADEFGIDGRGKLLELVIVHGQPVVVACKEEPLEHRGEDFKLDGEDFFALAVYHAIAVVILDDGNTFVEGKGILEPRHYYHFAVMVNETIGDQRAVDVDSYDGCAFVEGGGSPIAYGYAEGAKGVVIAVDAVFHD